MRRRSGSTVSGSDGGARRPLVPATRSAWGITVVIYLVLMHGDFVLQLEDAQLCARIDELVCNVAWSARCASSAFFPISEGTFFVRENLLDMTYKLKHQSQLLFT